MKQKRYTAPYIIAFHFGCDIGEIQDSRYQPTRYTAPAVYTVGDDYYCCPSGAALKLPKDWEWVKVAEYYGRQIFRSVSNEAK